jgi:hypothetical protein
MNGAGDDDVKRAFETLGSQVTAGAPSFAALASDEALRSARRRHRRRRGLVATMGIAALVLATRDRGAGDFDYDRFTALTGIDLGEVTWTAPSDYLLDVPGSDLLGSVPVIEVAVPVTGPDTMPAPIRNDTQRRSPS